MATILSYQPMNIVEAQKRAGYTNTAEFLGELLKQNDILNFLPFLPANHGVFHEWTEASRLGSGAWAKANTAIPLISSGSDVQRTGVFLYEGESQVDRRILDAVEDKMATRDSEDAANMEGFFQCRLLRWTLCKKKRPINRAGMGCWRLWRNMYITVALRDGS